jgi:hypothetical protein
MKAVKMNMNVVNCVLLVVILALVIYCVVRQNEGFAISGMGWYVLDEQGNYW